MAPAPITEDYYAILEVAQDADGTAIRASYRRLAKLRHPDKATADPQATKNFQLLQAAYSTLSNTLMRMNYDLQYSQIKKQNPHPEPKKPEPEPEPEPTWARSSAGASSRTGAQRPRPGSEEDGETQRRLEELRQKLSGLQRSRANLQSNLRQAEKEAAETQAVLDRLQREADEDAQDAQATSSWGGYLRTFVTNRATLEAEARKRRAIDREHAKRFREEELQRRQDRATGLKVRVDKCDREINYCEDAMERLEGAESARLAREELRRARLREEERQREAQREAERRKEEAEKVRREAERRSREAELKQREEQRRREEAESAEREASYLRLAAERRRRQEAELKLREEQRRREEEESAEREASYLRLVAERRLREGAERLRREQDQKKQAQRDRPTPADPSLCLHRRWWDRIEGRGSCSHCGKTLLRFALQCPKCQKIACARCMKTLKGK